MSRFQYAMGYLAAIGGAGTFIAILIAVFVFKESAILFAKAGWMLFVFLWGIGRIRTYRYIKNTKGGS